MAKNAFKLSTMVGQIFEIYLSQTAKNVFKLSTMVGEHFEIYLSQMDKNAFYIVHRGWKKYKFRESNCMVKKYSSHMPKKYTLLLVSTSIFKLRLSGAYFLAIFSKCLPYPTPYLKYV